MVLKSAPMGLEMSTAIGFLIEQDTKTELNFEKNFLLTKIFNENCRIKDRNLKARFSFSNRLISIYRGSLLSVIIQNMAKSKRNLSF